MKAVWITREFDSEPATPDGGVLFDSEIQEIELIILFFRVHR
jgi:hypothetical protein